MVTAFARIAQRWRRTVLATSTRQQQLDSRPRPLGLLPRANFGTATTNRIVRADFSRDARLLDASIAGVVLSFCPRDEEMRQKAQESWGVIRALLADALFEDADAIPCEGDESVGSAAACGILRKRYSELRSLACTIASTSFENGSDADIAKAGQALCRLAVKLDDLMEGTQRRLQNKLRQYVFSSGEELRLSA
jgi:hypothetical protein